MTNQSLQLDRHLQSLGGAWTGVPDFCEFSEKASHFRMSQLRNAILTETDADPVFVDRAYETGAALIDDIYRNFNGAPGAERFERVFMVTRRAHKADGDEYESESRYHFPLATSNFCVSPEMRMRSQFGLPPFVSDTYTRSDKAVERGALVIAPLYQDMNVDIVSEADRLAVGYRALEASVRFSHHKLGASVIGLGALLPQITKFGSLLTGMEGAEQRTTTTGHGGTVHLIAETVRKVLEVPSVGAKFDGVIGVIGGAGSIGWSTISTIRHMLPDVKVHTFDTRVSRLRDILDDESTPNVRIYEGVIDVLEASNIIVSAITSVIDLGAEEQRLGRSIDLSGKVIIDDSQPGSFHRQQVEERGGKVVWVVGKDISPSGFMTRDGLYTGGVPYNYGDKSGLYGIESEFGCGIEAAVIAQACAYEKAIKAPVTPDDVKKIGELFESAGATVAEFQSFGQPVELI